MITLGTLKSRAKFWIKRLGLEHWDIEFYLVDEIEDMPDARASCQPDDSYDHAEIKIVRTADNLDYLLVHELLHVHFRDLDQVAQGLMGLLGWVLADGHRKRWTHEEEGLIHRLTLLLLHLNE